MSYYAACAPEKKNTPCGIADATAAVRFRLAPTIFRRGAERAVGSTQGELNAWNEFLQNSGWDKSPKNPQIYDPDAYSLLASNFQQGETSLLDFIKQRQAVLEVVINRPT